MNPVEALPILANKMSNINSLNCGGCCVFATHVAKYLQQHVPVRIVIFNPPDYPSIDSVRTKLKNPRSARQWYKNGMAFFHILIEFDYEGKTYLCDSTGVFPASNQYTFNGWMELYRTSGSLTMEEASALAANHRAWNWRFDRRQIPKIKKRISRFFAKYNTNLSVAF